MSGDPRAQNGDSLWVRLFRLLDGRLPELRNASTAAHWSVTCSSRVCVGLTQDRSGGNCKIALDFWIERGQDLRAAVRQASELLIAIMKEIPARDWPRIVVVCGGKHTLGKDVVRTVTESLQRQFQELH